MRYLLPLALLALTPLPAAALSRQDDAACISTQQTSSEIAQGRCYQVASYLNPNALYCQEVGKDQFGRPVWLCCGP